MSIAGAQLFRPSYCPKKQQRIENAMWNVLTKFAKKPTSVREIADREMNCTCGKCKTASKYMKSHKK